MLDMIERKPTAEELAELPAGSTTRAMEFAANEIPTSDANTKRLRFLAATEEPYVRSAWFGKYEEVTVMSRLDQTNLKSGNMPLLNTHKNTDIEDSLGTIVGYKLIPHRLTTGEASTALEVVAEFRMDDEHSRRAYEKIQSGIIRNVSIGYKLKMPNPYEITRVDGDQGFNADQDIAAYVRLVNWEILEISLVPVPADFTAGFGRAEAAALVKAFEAGCPSPKIIPQKSNSPRSNAMTEDTKQETAEAVKAEAPSPEAIEKQIAAEPTKTEEKVEVKAEAPAAPAIEVKNPPSAPTQPVAVDAKFNRAGSAYLAKNSLDIVKGGATEEFVKALAARANEGEGLTEAETKAEIFDHLSKQDTKTMSSIAQGQAPAIAVKDADHNTFNFGRLGQILARGEAYKIDGREGEVITEFSKHGNYNRAIAPVASNPKHSVIVPHEAFQEDPEMKRMFDGMLTRRFDVADAATGFHVDKPDYNWITDRLINRATCLPYVPFLPEQQAQDLIGMVVSGEYATGFTTQNATRTETTGLAFSNRALRYHLAYGRADFSQQSLDQATGTAFFGTAVMKLNEDIGRRLDKEFVLGTSQAAGGFRGLLNYESVVDVSGVNGEVLAYGTLTDMIATMEASNAAAERAKFVVTPKVKSWLRQIQRQAGATGGQADVIISQQLGSLPQVDGHDVITSNWAELKGVTKGNQANNNEWIFLVDFQDIIGCFFSGMEMVVDTSSGIEQGITKVFVRQALDIQLSHSASVLKGSFRRT